MKVLLFTGHNKKYIPPKVKKIMQEDGLGNPDNIKARTKRVISYIEENSIMYDSVMQDDALEQLAASEDAIVNYRENPIYYFVKKGTEIFCMCVKMVDDSKKWVIKQNENKGEYIEYVN